MIEVFEDKNYQIIEFNNKIYKIVRENNKIISLLNSIILNKN